MREGSEKGRIRVRERRESGKRDGKRGEFDRSEKRRRGKKTSKKDFSNFLCVLSSFSEYPDVHGMRGSREEKEESDSIFLFPSLRVAPSMISRIVGIKARRKHRTSLSLSLVGCFESHNRAL